MTFQRVERSTSRIYCWQDCWESIKGRTMKRKLILVTLRGLALNGVAMEQSTCKVEVEGYGRWSEPKQGVTAPAAPGESVLLTCDKLPVGAVDVGLQSGTAPRTSVYAGTFGPNDKAIPKFQVPSSMKEGWYDIIAKVGTVESPLGRLQVMGPVTVTAIYPETLYPDTTGYDFNIVGSNFSPIPEENRIEIKGQGFMVFKNECPAKTITPPPNPDVNPPPPCLRSVEATELKFEGFHPTRFLGPTQFVVHVGSGSSTAVAVSFSYASQQLVALAAAAVFFGLAFLFYP